MKKHYYLLSLISILSTTCLAQKNDNHFVGLVNGFRATTPFNLDNNRDSLLRTFELYSDSFPPDAFKEYLMSTDQLATQLEMEVPILYAYREAFDKIIYELESVKVEEGTTAIWKLYNMGFVIKTPTACFGIDLDHRLAEQFEPYLDFLCITHNHIDHANQALMKAMSDNNKPVFSNFYDKSEKFLSKEAKQYKIGDITIRTDMSDHLRNTDLDNFVTLFRIECGERSGNFSLLHCGDSGFIPDRFRNVEGPVNLLIMRWGAPRENDVLGNGDGQVQPDYAVLSHLIELRHQPYPKGQASITKTLEHLPNVDCKNTILPFWGERLTWKNGQLF